MGVTAQGGPPNRGRPRQVSHSHPLKYTTVCGIWVFLLNYNIRPYLLLYLQRHFYNPSIKVLLVEDSLM